jgi:hypothetical protein
MLLCQLLCYSDVFDHDGVTIDDGINLVKWSVLPESHFFNDCIGNLGNQSGSVLGRIYLPVRL